MEQFYEIRRWVGLVALAAILVVGWAVAHLEVPVVLAGAVGQPGGMAPAQQTESRLVFADDFEDPTSGWQIRDEGEAFYRYTDGEYQIRVNEPFYAASVTADIKLKNYILEVDVRPVTTQAGLFGVAFAVNATSAYALALNNRSEFSIVRVSDGNVNVELGLRYSRYLNPGLATNHLRIIRRGMEVTIEANGNPLTSLRLASPDVVSNGLAVLSLADTPVDVRFDHFRLYTFSAEGTDYIKHKATWASSLGADSTVQSAVDGDPNTVWVSDENAFQLYSIDAGSEEYVFDQVFVEWAEGVATQWGLAVWDGTTWQLAGWNGDFKGVRSFEFDPLRGRYWVIGMVERDPAAAAYQVSEISLRGPAGQNPNLALRKRVTASSSGDEVNPQYVVDHNMVTQWVSDSNEKQWLRVNLGQPLPFNRITLTWGDNFGKTYAILAGQGLRWKLVGSTRDGQGGTETYDFDRLVARRLLILLRKPAQEGPYALREIGVWDTIAGGRLDVPVDAGTASVAPAEAAGFPPLPDFQHLLEQGPWTPVKESLKGPRHLQ